MDKPTGPLSFKSEEEIRQHVAKRREDIEKHEKQLMEDEKKAHRKPFVEEANQHGITEKQLEFIEKYFERKGHRHWVGLGGSGG